MTPILAYNQQTNTAKTVYCEKIFSAERSTLSYTDLNKSGGMTPETGFVSQPAYVGATTSTGVGSKVMYVENDITKSLLSPFKANVIDALCKLASYANIGTAFPSNTNNAAETFSGNVISYPSAAATISTPINIYTGAAAALTLPAISAFDAYFIQNAGSGTATITCDGSDEITDGVLAAAATYALSAGSSCFVFADAKADTSVTWIVIPLY